MARAPLLLPALLLSALARARATALGIDVSQPVSAAAAACMAKAGRSYSITRAWESVGAFDAHAPATMAAFASAGVEVSIYMFPCSFQSPQAQLAALQGNLTAAGAPSFSKMWLDVESNIDPRCAWSKTNLTANCDYMSALVGAALGNPFFSNRTGIYTSVHEWTLLMGADCTAGSSVPLWYPHYEAPPNPTFSDFKSFGGWTAPAMKQYADGPPVCADGPATDLNYRPE